MKATKKGNYISIISSLSSRGNVLTPYNSLSFVSFATGVRSRSIVLTPYNSLPPVSLKITFCLLLKRIFNRL